MNRRIIIIGLIAAAAAGGYFIKRSGSDGPAPTTVTVQTVRLASSKNLWAALPVLAQKQGYFEANGLKVEINFVQAAKFAMDALAGGSADCGTVVETNVAFLGYTGNKEVAVAATICESGDSAIIARKSAGITQASDLKGKKLGLLPGTTSQIYAERLLEKGGLTLADVQVSNLQAPAMQPSFIEKAVDAVSIWQPFASNIAKAGGDDVVILRDPSVYEAMMNIAVGRKWAQENKGTLLAFLKALRQAEAFIKDKPAEAQAVLAAELNLDPALVASFWNQYRWEVKLDSAKLLQAIQSEGEWIKRSQQGFGDKAVPDYAGADYIDGSYLAELK